MPGGFGDAFLDAGDAAFGVAAFGDVFVDATGFGDAAFGDAPRGDAARSGCAAEIPAAFRLLVTRLAMDTLLTWWKLAHA